MYHVNAQGIDEHMINVHYYYYYCCQYLLKKKVAVFLLFFFPFFLLGVGVGGGCFEFELLKEQPHWFIFCQ